MAEEGGGRVEGGVSNEGAPRKERKGEGEIELFMEKERVETVWKEETRNRELISLSHSLIFFFIK